MELFLTNKLSVDLHTVLLVYNTMTNTTKICFSEFISHKIPVKYHSVKMVGPDSKANEHVARNMAIDFCLETKCDFYLSLDGEAHLDNPRTLKLLIGQVRNCQNSSWDRQGIEKTS